MLSPADAMDLWSDYEPAAIIAAAFEHGLFRPLLQGEALDADSIAASVGAPALFVEQMLDCLVFLGAAKLRGKKYMLTAAWQRWLHAGHDEHRGIAMRRVAPIRQWFALGPHRQSPSGVASQEEEMFRTGVGLERYLRGVQAFNRPMIRKIADVLAPRLCRKSHPSVADIGGGHAGYLLELLSRHPEMRGDIIDLPATTAISRRMNEGNPLVNRLRFIDADARTLTAPEHPYDLVMVNDLLHSFPLHDKLSIVKNALGIVRPGGILAFTKFTHAVKRSLRDNAMFSMKLFVNTNGQGYLESDEALVEMMDRQGAQLLDSFHIENKSGFIFSSPQ